MYIMNVCLVILVILLFFIYVYVDEHKEMLFEGLRNEEDGVSDTSGIAWNRMYTCLTPNDDGNYCEYYNLGEGTQYSPNYFESNLDETEVENDFKYFNNATAIYAGYSYKEKS